MAGFSALYHLPAARIFFILMACAALLIGLYPLLYILTDMSNEGLLATKSAVLKASWWWQLAFYAHISGGGIALFIGWLQFWKKLRIRYPRGHRFIGYVYVGAVLSLGGIGGLFAAFYATGGWITQLGFSALALGWLYTTLQMLLKAKAGKLTEHRHWAIRSYSLCLAAVSLRIWLPLLAGYYEAFLPAYLIVSWLCWVPNLLIAELIIRYTSKKPASIRFTSA